MVTSLPTAEPDVLQHGIKASVKETLLTPRFCTTDFEVFAKMSLSLQAEKLQAPLAELRADYNRQHFVSDLEFEQTWAHIDGDTRRAFIDFLEWSCPSEFFGFLQVNWDGSRGVQHPGNSPHKSHRYSRLPGHSGYRTSRFLPVASG